MKNAERLYAIFNYRNYDRMPLIHFGFWQETLIKWATEGHITMEDALNWSDATPPCKRISKKLGFDFNWFNTFPGFKLLTPLFEEKVLKENPDGSKEILNSDGVVVLQKAGSKGIPSEITHFLKDRESWERLYKPRLKFTDERVNKARVNTGSNSLLFSDGGLEYLRKDNRENPMGLMLGSMLGRIRDWLGLVGLSYLIFDDPNLLEEIIQTVSDLLYQQAEYILKQGVKFDFAHFWEDICFKNGPLISPDFFRNQIGPQYKKLTILVNNYGINIVSVDCDGVVDSLVPTWLENGVNTMFPIEVGTWGANIEPWRKKYGRDIRGVGGMDKRVLAYDRAAIDAEIERLKPLVELGGYIPCPDHRIPPDAKWENVQYHYCPVNL